MSFSTIKRLAAKFAPDRAADYVARNRFARHGRDANNFSDLTDLRTQLGAYEVLSFDFFDTLVWRTVALQDVHRKTSEFADSFVRGDDGPLPAGLLLNCRQRFQEAVKARGMACGPAAEGFRNEVDLAEVFAAALAPYIADPDRRAAIAEMLIGYEIETEKRILVADPRMKAALAALRAQGKTLILISDMYFAESHVRDLLAHLGLLELFDHVLVSATEGVTKHSGLLFARADARLGLAGRRRIHFGDNWNNDVVQPRRMGWDALHYLNTENEIRKEALEIRARLGVATMAPMQTRALRSALLSGGTEDTLQVMAACFSGFARQALSLACREGVGRILFLTRDGSVFEDLMRQYLAGTGVAGKMALPEMGELALSRRAGVLLNYPDRDDPTWRDYLVGNVQWLTDRPFGLASVMRAFSLGAADLDLDAALHERVEKAITEPESDLDTDALLEEPELVAALDAALVRRRQDVRDYLAGTGLLGRNEKVLLVDIGYSGTAAKALSEYIYTLEAGGQDVPVRLSLLLLAANRFYDENLGRMHPRMTMHAAALIGTQDWRHRAVAANFAWLEPFAVDRSRGSLRGYVPGPDGMVPYFAPGEVARGDCEMRRAVLAAAARYEAALRAAPLAAGQGDRLMLAEMIRIFTRPDTAAVAAMRGITHHGGLAEVEADGVIARLRPLHLPRDLVRALRSDRWMQGSLRASGLGLLNPLFNRMIGILTR